MTVVSLLDVVADLADDLDLTELEAETLLQDLVDPRLPDGDVGADQENAPAFDDDNFAIEELRPVAS